MKLLSIRPARAAIFCLGLVAVACGGTDATIAPSSDGETAASDSQENAGDIDGLSGEDGAVDETAAVVDSVPQPQTDAPTDREFPPLPTFADPCAEERPVGDTTYSIFVDGKERPVLVSLDSTVAASPEPALMVGLHGAGWSIDRMKGVFKSEPRVEPHVVVVASSGNQNANYWTENDEFNRVFITALFDELADAICFDVERSIISSYGQGSFVAATAICDTDIPLRRVIMSFSLISFQDCEPSRSVSIVSMNVFEFSADVGAHWDGVWDPPVAYELERTGGIGPAPADLDEWADLYGCEGLATQQTLPDPADTLDRDTVRYGYLECETPLIAYGVQNGDVDPAHPAAVRQFYEDLITLD